MRIKVRSAFFHDGVSLSGGIFSSVSTGTTGGARHVDEIEATPVGLVIRQGTGVSLVPWGSVKSCPDVEVLDGKPGKEGK